MYASGWKNKYCFRFVLQWVRNVLCEPVYLICTAFIRFLCTLCLYCIILQTLYIFFPKRSLSQTFVFKRDKKPSMLCASLDRSFKLLLIKLFKYLQRISNENLFCYRKIITAVIEYFPIMACLGVFYSSYTATV